MKTLLDMTESNNGEKLTIEEVQRLVKMETIDDCKQYMKVMLDFLFDIIKSPEGRLANSSKIADRNLWVQTIFSKGCHFLYLLNGVGYNKGIDRLNPIIDPSVLFTLARRIYESVITFELLFVIPQTKDKQTILYNLFIAQGLTERLKDLDEEMRSHNPERIKEELNDIENCKKAIEETMLYKNLDNQTKNVIQNAFGKKYRYIFTENNTLKKIEYNDAYEQLRIKNEFLKSTYSYFSLQSHPSYLALIQFRDAFVEESRADLSIMVPHATQCVLSFMSIFIVDYMKLNPSVLSMFSKLEEPRQFAIGMYEDAMRGEQKFQ